MPEKIWLSSPHMSDEGYEPKYIQEAFDTNWIAPLGPNVNGFEQELAAKVGAKHAAALVSGTAAIHMALKAVGVGEGDVVLCQDLTFAATANPILYQNATPVFIDSDNTTWNMDPAALETACEKYKDKVKAVIVVHLYGLSADMDKISDICERYGIVVIEDAAESLGTTYKGKQRELWALLACILLTETKSLPPPAAGCWFPTIKKNRKSDFGLLKPEIKQGIISIARWDIIIV